MIRVQLADPAARLPMPGQPAGVFAPAGPFEVEEHSSFWSALLADGSVIKAAPAEDKPAAQPAKSKI